MATARTRRGRGRRLAGLAVAVLALAIGAVVAWKGLGGDGRAVADRFVAPDGAGESACLHDAPCRTLDQAYRAAVPGEVVEVAAGDYGNQTIAADPAKSGGPAVVLRPARDARVEIAELRIEGASGLEFRDMVVDTYYLFRARDITLRDLRTRNDFINASSGVRMIGGSVGPYRICVEGCSSAGLSIAPNDPSLPRSRDILIDGVDFREITRDPGQHGEALSIWSAEDVTVRRSRFRDCAVYCISVDRLQRPETSRRVRIENNWLDCGADCSANLTYWVEGMIVRNNSFRGPPFTPLDTVQEQSPNSDVRFVGNVGPSVGVNCDLPNQTFAHNVWNGSACGPTDLDAPEGYVDPEAGDLHLRPDAAAIDRGDPADHPRDDIDGDPRPEGAAPDAGADEVA